MNFWTEFFTIATINLLAVISPGPAFALVIRNSLRYSKTTAVYTAVGLGLGVAVHIINSLIGVGYIVSQSESLFNILKVIGAFYLIYVGYKSFIDVSSDHQDDGRVVKGEIPNTEAIKMGFFTNATNPRALVFFMSLYATAVSRATPLAFKALYGLEMALAEFAWFALVGTLITHRIIKAKVGKIQYIVERVMGVIIILLGIKILLF